MAEPSYDTPPAPPDAADALRWEESRRRERMLSGRWKTDLEDALVKLFGLTRRPIIGRKSLAENPFRNLCNQLACNYIDAPMIAHPSGEYPELLAGGGILDQASLCLLLRRLQPRLIGLREMLIHVAWSPEQGRPVLRLVRPDTVTAQSRQSNPGTPVALQELRWRGGRWCWDVYSIDGAPFFRVLDAEQKQDLTADILGGSYEGDAYPYRYNDGRPFLPYTMYHASCRERLWDPYEGIEVVDGTLDLACAYTYQNHTLFKAAFPQRWALNAHVQGVAASPDGRRTEVPTDPTGLLHLGTEADLPQGAPVQIGQWGPGADPEMIARVIAKMRAAIATFDGIGGGALVENSSNPMSAEALVLSNEGRREAQRRYSGELEPSDLELIGKIAAVSNLEGLTDFPESGYQIRYRAIPLSASEQDARRRHASEMVASGRWSIVDAYLHENPGLLRSEAVAALERIAAENARFRVAPGTQPAAYTVQSSTSAPPPQ